MELKEKLLNLIAITRYCNQHVLGFVQYSVISRYDDIPVALIFGNLFLCPTNNFNNGAASFSIDLSQEKCVSLPKLKFYPHESVRIKNSGV